MSRFKSGAHAEAYKPVIRPPLPTWAELPSTRVALAACHQRTSLPSINPPANADNPVWSGRGHLPTVQRTSAVY